MSILQLLRISTYGMRRGTSKRQFFTLRTRPQEIPDSENGPILPSNQLVDEEMCPGYDPREYDAKSHLAELIALLGPPPRELLTLSEKNSQLEWPEAGKAADGKFHSNARDYFRGPYFDSEGM